MPARLNLGDMLGPADMTLLSAVADGWPALRAHFGDQLLTRLSGDSLVNHDNGMTWNWLALVADRQRLLSQDSHKPSLTRPRCWNDRVLAWYTSTHRRDDNLTDILISRLDNGTDAAPSPAYCSPTPPTSARPGCRSRAAGHCSRPTASGTRVPVRAPRALSDGVPDDDLVQIL